MESVAAETRIVTLSGRGAPLKPIHALHRATGPAIRLRAGSLGPMLPLRDLVVGAGQWLRCETLLLPARLLVNGAGITEEADTPLIQVGLAAPDELVAEGTALLALPLPDDLALPEPGLTAALRAMIAHRAASATAHPAAATLDRLLSMTEPRDG